MNNGFREAVVACDMPEPCKFPSLGSSQKKFQWTDQEVDLAPHPAVGLVLHVGDAEKFPRALCLNPVSRFSSRVHVSQP